MSQPAALSPRRDAASPVLRAWASAALLALAFAAVMLLAGPTSARSAPVGPACAAVAVAFAGPERPQSSAPRDAADTPRIGVIDIDPAAEFGLPRAAADGARPVGPKTTPYAAAHESVPAAPAVGSPRRPPRPA